MTEQPKVPALVVVLPVEGAPQLLSFGLSGDGVAERIGDWLACSSPARRRLLAAMLDVAREERTR